MVRTRCGFNTIVDAWKILVPDVYGYTASEDGVHPIFGLFVTQNTIYLHGSFLNIDCAAGRLCIRANSFTFRQALMTTLGMKEHPTR